MRGEPPSSVSARCRKISSADLWRGILTGAEPPSLAPGTSTRAAGGASAIIRDSRLLKCVAAAGLSSFPGNADARAHACPSNTAVL